MIGAEPTRGGKLPASDFAAPLVRRAMRVLVIGAQPTSDAVASELDRLGAGDAMSLDDRTPEQRRHALAMRPVDVVLIVGPIWTSPLAAAPPRLTAAGAAVEPYLRGNGWPVHWLRGDTCNPIAAMPAPGDA